jgi:L-ascorbate metabolism protein UlaG (beta-lactamase superfamily)
MGITRHQFIRMILWVFIGFLAAGYGILRMPQFGSIAKGDRRRRILASPQFKNGTFQNIHPTPDLTEGYSTMEIIYGGIFKRHQDLKPAGSVPFQKTDLLRLTDENQIIWFGHSSYLLVLEGKRILVDPVFSGHAAPFSFMMNAFDGANYYQPEHMPTLDILVLTHDHYDHLDYTSITKLRPKVKQIITSLGVGAHLEKWGYDPGQIHELDWGEKIQLENIEFTACPARHFSGRTFRRKITLWSAFAVQSNTKKIYIGGDSGYDDQFALRGREYGPFDLALLECGQYSPYWKYIHMAPEETAQAAIDLQAKTAIPVHWGKFPLAQHAWNDPIQRFEEAATKLGQHYIKPEIGAIVYF